MKNLLIIGAGGAGKHLLSELLKKDKKLGYNIIGFLDADSKKHGMSISGYKVLGHHDNIMFYIKKYNIDEVIIATTAINHKDLDRLYRQVNKAEANFRVLPPIEELLLNEPFTKQLREIKVDDLLGRDTININSQSVKEYLKNRIVLVTGAAGSIGSELCRQIVRYEPSKLILLDINENDLYFLDLYIQRHFKVKTSVEICNIRELYKLDYLFNKYQPDIVFHAAAHKHVPLMEKNIEEAVKNNVFGTENIVISADKYNVAKFVLVSTDKAVNPTNVMGATKRLAELIIEKYSKLSSTKFTAVRFGNVLGSNGSVVPLFKSLLQEGKDLTVTHEEVSRYFMTIPEAAQLVLEAGYIANGGEVFVLDMGKPVRIMDLAKKMIELSGLELGKDVNINITGLRPGEKLYEELLYDAKSCQKTQNERIYIAKLKKEAVNIDQGLKELKKLLDTFDSKKMKLKLKELVPTYQEVDYNINGEIANEYTVISS
ncbi:NAD-dependent epimerase/dehydratase family protein [Iocasia frigidifontis]|uniref:NAD-dependent epimerase/dehydratase family protein n=1 Tax=Iocasia fonsfrigidae TaxID=2682810 RepID=A0A8A7KIU8_9FIRM|nr:nucleoside-diphosphate sugar epimerase/dehydratase [Iocasia fonsfrigidae]QTL99738.1 NAD-dependent epimerase/dehydratase family protein [Iocasia fonsfrigidae]